MNKAWLTIIVVLDYYSNRFCCVDATTLQKYAVSYGEVSKNMSVEKLNVLNLKQLIVNSW